MTGTTFLGCFFINENRHHESALHQMRWQNLIWQVFIEVTNQTGIRNYTLK